jgi:CDP-diacylglycerol--glycerol-3-phosphate 3-phosphatidyltransferase
MKDLFNVPNTLSVSRMVLTIPVVFLLLDRGPLTLLIAIVLLNYLELTDATDGFIARKWGQVTDVGKLLDPMFDSLCRFTVFATLLTMEILPLWMLLIFFYRDVSVSYYRAFSAQRNVTMSARISGKVKAVVQGVGVLLVCIIMFSQHLQADPQPFSDAVYYGVFGAGVAVCVAFLAGFRIWGPVVATISAVGGGTALLTTILWVTKVEIPYSDQAIWGVLFAVTAVTAWSYLDYTRGFLDVLRQPKG